MEGARLVRVPSFSLRQDEADAPGDFRPAHGHMAGCQEMPARDRAGGRRATFSGH